MVLWIIDGFRHAGSPLQTSLVLPEAFRQVGPDWDGYDYLAETLRSALPLLVRFGITTEQEADVDRFAKRLREEVVSQRSYVVLSLMVGAWVHIV